MVTQMFVEKYLSKNFLIKKHKRKNCLFDKETNSVVYSNHLKEELKAIFSISDEEAVKYVEVWCLKNFNKRLSKYWGFIWYETDFREITFPIVRRVFSKILANDIVSVQPMNLPSGQLFFMDFNREENNNQIINNQIINNQHVILDNENLFMENTLINERDLDI